MFQKIKKLESKKNYFSVLSFTIPLIILTVIYIVEGFHPFGDSQILIIDAYHQYYHFMIELKEKILNGESLFYSWNMGLGTDYLSLMAYYAASPLNLLSIFIPEAYMSIFFAMLIGIKIGLAGLTFSFYLKSIYGKSDYSSVAFSLFYALCGFIAGYYWNIMWLDVFFLFPLVILGLKNIIGKNKYFMYLISLGLCFFTNYYMSIFVCIFTVIYYVLYSINLKVKFKDFIIKGFKILGISILAAGLFAWILIPAAVALTNVYKTASPFVGKVEVYESFVDVIANVLAFNYPTVREGLPNLYSGLISIYLTFVYFYSKKIKLREKIISLVTIVFLILSTNINILDYIWHGFRYTNMLPYRFTFIYSFVIGIISYKGYKNLKSLKVLEMSVIGLITLVFVIYFGKTRENILLLANIIVITVYIILLIINKVKYRKSVEIFLFFIIIAEVFANTYIGFETAGKTTYSIFNENRNEIEGFIDYVEEKNEDNFYRMEIVNRFTFNDPALYQYKGMSLFSSTIDGRVSTFLENTGIPSYPLGNRYYYTYGTPFTNSIFNINYLISRKEELKDDYSMKKIDEKNSIYLYENNKVLPLGFMINDKDLQYRSNLTDNQNSMFKSFTGLDENILNKVERNNILTTDLNIDKINSDRISYTINSAVSDGDFSLEYIIPKTGYYYYESEKIDEENVEIYHNEEIYDIEFRRDSIASLGYFEKGDTLKIKVKVNSNDPGNYLGILSILDEDIFEKGYDILDKQSAKSVKYKSSKVKMEVNVDKEGYFFTSIPYNEGWRVYIDGEEKEIVPYENAFIGLNLEKGKHIIEYKYMSVGFKEGMIISSISLVVIIFIYTKKKKSIK